MLGIELPRLDALRAKRPKRLPAVLSPEEVRRFLDAVDGCDGLYRLMARLLYGTGLRRQECCQLRIHDLDLQRYQVTVRHGKGGKDRVVMLPRSLQPDLLQHLAQRKEQHDRDRARGQAYAPLPFALARKLPARRRNWAGSSCSLPRAAHAIRKRVTSSAFTSTPAYWPEWYCPRVIE